MSVCGVYRTEASRGCCKQAKNHNKQEEEEQERWNLTHISVSNIWHKQTTAETQKACRQKLQKRHTNTERERERTTRFTWEVINKLAAKESTKLFDTSENDSFLSSAKILSQLCSGILSTVGSIIFANSYSAWQNFHGEQCAKSLLILSHSKCALLRERVWKLPSYQCNSSLSLAPKTLLMSMTLRQSESH